MRNGTPEQSAIVRKAIEEGGLEYLEQVMEAIRHTGAIEYTEQTARQEAELAIQQLQHLPESDYKAAMIALARYSVDRVY
jgi:octaprenyl-diphosphate synthase